MMSLLLAATDPNPISMLEEATKAVPAFGGDLSAPLNILMLLTVLTVAPAILILCTCFTRVIIVLSLLRQAMGTNTLPPSQVIVGLSVFITIVAMAPTATKMYEEGLRPYMNGEQRDQSLAWERAKQPLRDFMFSQIDATGNWSAVYMMLKYRGVDVSDPSLLSRADVDMVTLVPAYVISELKTSFLIGFRVFLPFLVIDMVVSSLLISMGMMMLPPVLISLPFKLLMFVMVDGWQLVVGSLMAGIMQPQFVAGVFGSS
jgi:flagellar biosynthesis protein FliP